MVNDGGFAGFTVHVNGVNPSVRDRINSVNAAFCNSDGNRSYRVNTNRCPVVTENFEQQVYNEKGEPDKTQGKDHTNDAAGYFISYDYPIIKPVSNVNVKWAM